ncbi:MAG: GC-type dockerin domain-anchored protein [Phycisphaerales bacterium]
MRFIRQNSIVATALALAAGSTTALAGGTVSGSIVVKEGDALSDSTVSTLNTPFTDGNGKLGTVIALADGRRAIWHDAGVVFTSDEALPDALTGGEGTMGIGNDGEFIYSPSYNGNDAVWGDAGLILAGTQQAPGYPVGVLNTFNSRPRMSSDGTAYWIAGSDLGAGGSTAQRALYSRSPAGAISIVIASGDLVPGGGGLTVDFPSGVDFNYHFSGDGAHSLITLLADTGSTADDDLIVVDGAVVARETLPTGDGDNWDNFDDVSINASGNYLFTGDTDGATASDEFIAYNAVIGVREDDVVDGLTLGGSANAASINDLNQAIFIFSTDEETETLFFAADASDLGSAVKLASVDDLFDDGEGPGADWIIDDFNASNVIGPGLDLAEDGYVYVEVDLVPVAGGDPIEAIIRLALPSAGCNAADLAEPFGQLNFDDVIAFLTAFGNMDPAADLAEPFGQFNFDDVIAFLTIFGAGCP